MPMPVLLNMELREMVFRVVSCTKTPSPPLKAMMFRALLAALPMVVSPPALFTPWPPLPMAVVPSGSVPMKLRSITFGPDEKTSIPSPEKPLIERPRTIAGRLAVPPTTRPSAAPALVPRSSMRGEPAQPGCDVASIETSKAVGKGLDGVMV